MMNQNTFENFCDKYKIIYSIEPYDHKRNVIKIPQRNIYSNCIICIGNCLIAEDLLNKSISDGIINYLTIFSGNNITINNIIEKIYNCINKVLPNVYLIIFVTYNHIYFQLIDKLFEKYVLFANKEYTTHILFRFQCDELDYDKLVFEYNFKEYEFNDENLSKIIRLYKNKYTINQQIKNMYYVEHDNGNYYIKCPTFGKTILQFEIKTNNLENVYIEYNKKIVNINRLDNIIKNFNSYKRD